MRANLDIHALSQVFVEQPLATITPSSSGTSPTYFSLRNSLKLKVRM